jgi:hypothetical protein
MRYSMGYSMRFFTGHRMGHAWGYPKGIPLGYPSGYPIGYHMESTNESACTTQASASSTFLDGAMPRSDLSLSVAVTTALIGLIPHCRCAATLSTCYALVERRHGPCRKPWLASRQRQQQTPTRTCTISITGFPE